MTEPRVALAAIGQLTDAEIDIGNAALQFARIDVPEADWHETAAHLSTLAREAVQRAASLDDRDIPSRAATLSKLLSVELGYAGDIETYNDPANANLIRVIERRRGLPVALGVLWLHAARAAGWVSHGVDFPAHFLIALEGRNTQVIVDVFNGGRVMAAKDLRKLLKRIEGDKAELRPGLLQPMNTRRVLLRLQNNIMTRRLEAGDLRGGLACVEDMLLIAPNQAELWRQAGVMNQRLEQVAAATDCYLRFLRLVPEGSAADEIRAQVDILKSMLN